VLLDQLPNRRARLGELPDELGGRGKPRRPHRTGDRRGANFHDLAHHPGQFVGRHPATIRPRPGRVLTVCEAAAHHGRPAVSLAK
jgi:hypothetical protein